MLKFSCLEFSLWSAGKYWNPGISARLIVYHKADFCQSL